MKTLENIHTPEQLRKLSTQEKEQLAEELRMELLDVVSETGGHLASNLGVVELTIAIHSAFQTPKDKIIWDVGHQSYIHKMLTNRRDKMNSLRKLNGISGFPKSSESEYDCFETGHSSTSISAALGMARARDIKKENYHVVAVIGDGALTGGMALEALNDTGCSKTNIIVILNDNEMSISKNVGGISTFLTKLRTRKGYQKSNEYIKKLVRKLPGNIGESIICFVRKIKNGVKQLVIPNMLFEELGFCYLGPVDGHNIEKLEDIFRKAKEKTGPVLIHVLTKKGKGYIPAETNPDKFHSTSSFNLVTGESKKTKETDYSKVFGETLLEIAKNNSKIVAITAAMKDGTGLTQFAKEFPDRFFDVGIAEQHSLTMAAGMAKAGLKPVVSIYSSFYQRGYDQVIHDIAMQNLPVVLCVDRAGIVGNDGETHQGIFDMAFFNLVPNLKIMAPKDFMEFKQMLKYAISLDSPVVIRYPRGGEEKDISFRKHEQIKNEKAEILMKGEDITIVAIGKMVVRAYKIAESLKKSGINAEIINCRFLKPFDSKTIIDSVCKTRKIITIEDGIIKGGLASTCLESLANKKIKYEFFKAYGYPDEFVRHGKVEEIEKLYGLDCETITQQILDNKLEGWRNMEKQELLKQFPKQEDKLLIAKIWDKLKFVHSKNQVQVTDFLDTYEQSLVNKMLKTCREEQYVIYGGYETAERKILFLYPDKLQDLFMSKANNSIIANNIKVVSIVLPSDLYGKYHHSEYLGGIMKLGIKREKIGDIIVNEHGADILVQSEMATYLKEHLQGLTRFQKANICIKELSELKILPIKKEEINILIPQMRLDVIVSEILHLSRSKANEIISQERVFVNNELKTKNATMLKLNDVLTIRGKGKFEIGEVISQTSKGKIRLQIKKYVS